MLHADYNRGLNRVKKGDNRTVLKHTAELEYNKNGYGEFRAITDYLCPHKVLTVTHRKMLYITNTAITNLQLKHYDVILIPPLANFSVFIIFALQI